jgi:hypothetical protein
MQTTRRRELLYAMLGFTFGQLLIGAKPLTAQNDCKPVLDAMTKLFDTPTHGYLTTNVGGKLQTGESIYAGGSIYSKSDGKWITAATTKEMKELDEKNRQNNKTTCRYLKDEPVNGEMAAVYSVHSVHEAPPKSTSDSKTWISKAKGLPLRTDTDMEGSHISMRFEYGNVKPPI